MIGKFLLVALGGALGSMARYGIYLAMNKYAIKAFPVATLTVNLIGCFLVGLLFGFTGKGATPPSGWTLVLATGFCGGFTTFSAFALDNNTLFRNEQGWAALVYTVFSVVIGILLCRLGIGLSGS
ncbi:MAG: crcB [Flavipsychrobacter sp.]|jgi:CrcB protein|nr:crcB [Flavipsychrobacter sp.]